MEDSSHELGPLARLDVTLVIAWAHAGVPIKNVDEACRNGIDPLDLVEVPLDDMARYGNYLSAAASRGVSAPAFFELVKVEGWTLRHLDWLSIGYTTDDLAGIAGLAGALATLSTTATGRGMDVPVAADRQRRHLTLVLCGCVQVPHEAAVALADLVPLPAVETMARFIADGMPVPVALRSALALAAPMPEVPAVEAGSAAQVRVPRAVPASDAVRSK